MNDLTTPVIDPITLEMLWRRLVSIVGELGSTLRRTSFSTVVRDIGDYGCGIFDAEGRLLAQTPDSTPGLCGPLGSMLRHMLAAHPPATLEEGDVVIGNNPWMASGHHNDISIMAPAFHKGRLIGFVATCCHHVDIGGRRATTESRDNYEEGLRIPAESKSYSVNEGNRLSFPAGYQAYLDHAQRNGYSSRYAGAMVADVHRILLKGGVFLYPPTAKAPKGKLRLMYEANPMAMLIEQAGGKALAAPAQRILEVQPGDIHQRTPVILGSADEVDAVVAKL